MNEEDRPIHPTSNIESWYYPCNGAGVQNAPTLVFIHGFPLSSAIWEKNIETLQEVAHIITLDLRGHGQSGWDDFPYSIDDMAHDIAVVIKSYPQDKAILVGHSMGGYISLRLAELYPNLTAGLILCNTKAQADDNLAKMKRFKQMADVKEHGMEQLAKALTTAMLAPEMLETNPLYAKVEAIISNTKPRAVAASLLALASRLDYSDVLSNLAFPTLVLAGEHDGITPAPLMRRMADQIPNAHYKCIANSGHLSCMENDTEFNAAILEFVKESF